MKPAWWWPYLLTALGVGGFYLVETSRRKLGWLTVLAQQVLWIVYGLTSHQTGFALSALAYGVVFIRNERKASDPLRREHSSRR